jgi:predicted PurR-regulated permease PerM/GAF domain-containing protein
MPERSSRRKAPFNSLIGLVAAVAILYFGREVFIPLALAGLLAFLLAPVATRLERFGLRRTPAVLLVIACAFSIIAALCWGALGQVYRLAVELPQYQENVTTKIDALHLHSPGKLSSTVRMLSQLSREFSSANSDTPAPASPVETVTPRRHSSAKTAPAAADALHSNAQAGIPPEPVTVRVEQPQTSIFNVAGSSFAPLIHPLTTAFIIVVFVIFILLARDDIRDRTIRLAGSSHLHITTVAMEDAGQRVSRYLRMQLIVNLSLGTLVGLALWAIGIPQPLLWGVLACLLRFIPYVGIVAAGTGPLLLAVAVSPSWSAAAWTFAAFLIVELIAGNFVEPYLYGSSTGVSALAILVAAIFWTWLWGLAGLFLATPLTVCLIVIGRHFPPLAFVGVLFGEDSVLEPPLRIYQRLLAGDNGSASRTVFDLLQKNSPEEVYDTVLLPVLALVEQARHSGEIDVTAAEQILQSIEEIADEIQVSSPLSAPATERNLPTILCAPALDFADEIAGQFLLQTAAQRYRGRAVPAQLTINEILELVALDKPSVVCVVGVPPHAIRHVRLRCQHLRTRYPDLVIIACVLSGDSDLSTVRSRIPIGDAQHVVCSLAQAREYLSALADPADRAPQAGASNRVEITQDSALPIDQMHAIELLDHAQDGIFSEIASALAKIFDVPIALIHPLDGEVIFWKAQCGLPELPSQSTLANAAPHVAQSIDLSICSRPFPDGSPLIVNDVCEDSRFANDAFFTTYGIRFFAAAPLLTQEGRQIGCICVLDTRPRQPTEQQRQALTKLANSVMNAIELRPSQPAEEMEVASPAG